MDPSVKGSQAPTNDPESHYHSKLLLSEKHSGFECDQDPDHDELFPHLKEFPSPGDIYSSKGDVLNDLSGPGRGLSDGLEGKFFQESYHSSARMAIISQMLMEEEDLQNQPLLLDGSSALQATEKSYYDILNNSDGECNRPNSQIPGGSVDTGSFVESTWIQEEMSSSQVQSTATPVVQSDLQWFDSSKSCMGANGVPTSVDSRQHAFQSHGRNTKDDPESFYCREKKIHQRESGDHIQGLRSNKLFANSICEFEPSELSDKVLLCSDFGKMKLSETDNIEAKKQVHQGEKSGRSTKGRSKESKRIGIVKEVVDLRSLLTQCAEAVASYDSRTVNDLLAKIRQHSSPHGDGIERVAHYFANAIEARLAGTGPASSPIHRISKRSSAAEKLKVYQMYTAACPFRKMSNLLANRTITKLAIGATTLHIIDFGILYGYQWPSLIQALSEREGGPPRLRITGIDFPQPGFRPTERVDESGISLSKYCEKFGVPFEFNGIAQKWETIKPEDLKIQNDELLVVNSLRFDNVPDETEVVNSPRETVLNLIRKINPNMFVHGILNAAYNTPFFITRFREALFHFSSMFDMLEATVEREDSYRMLFEKQVFGNDLINIIACEGAERIHRPETYKQWQVRNKRVGLRQIPLDQELLKYVRYRVKTEYNKDFLVDEDGKWMLQGWKGRVLHALSFWRPSQK